MRPMRAALPFLLLLAACAPPAIVPVVQTASVTADAETVAVKSGDDAADDPAIWRNAANPAASLIVGTDKQAGLYVYGLDGQVRDFNNAGRVNNVDLVETPAGVIIAASDRSDEAQAQIALFRLNTTTARLEPIGRVPAGAGEAYGLCLYDTGDALHAFVVMKDGTIAQLALDVSGAAPAARIGSGVPGTRCLSSPAPVAHAGDGMRNTTDGKLRSRCRASPVGH